MGVGEGNALAYPGLFSVKSALHSFEVLGYRLEGGRYVPIEPDERGWIYSATNEVWIGVTEEWDGFFVIDARSGERILPAQERAEMAEERAAAEAAARAKAERRVEAMEAELARQQEELARAGGSTL